MFTWEIMSSLFKNPNHVLFKDPVVIMKEIMSWLFKDPINSEFCWGEFYCQVLETWRVILIIQTFFKAAHSFLWIRNIN